MARRRADSPHPAEAQEEPQGMRSLPPCCWAALSW